MIIDFNNYHDLVTSSEYTRRDCLEQIVGMLPYAPGGAVTLLSNIVDFVGAELFDRDANGARMPQAVSATTDYLETGEMTPEHTINLLMATERRAKLFAEAIKRAKFPVGSPIVDIGTGSSAILSLISAVYNPDSAITAYEVNERSSMIARRVVEIFGLSDRVKVVHANYLQIEPEPAGMVVSETFAPGLCFEKGALLLAHAAKAGVDALIPDAVRMYASIGANEPAQASVIDLSNFDGVVRGLVKPGNGVLNVRSDYYSDKNSQPVIVGADQDVISGYVPLCNISPTEDELNASCVYAFSYPAGYNPLNTDSDEIEIKPFVYHA